MRGVATTTEEREDQQLMIIQIPLVVRNAKTRQQQINMQIEHEIRELPILAACCSYAPMGMRDASIEPSQISQGPFDGLKYAKLERDPYGPIRVTMQIYKVMLLLQAFQLDCILISLTPSLQIAVVTASTAQDHRHCVRM